MKLKKKSITFSTGQWPLNKKKPTIFFIHGAGQLSTFWEFQLIGLSNFANTIAINLPEYERHKQITKKIKNYSNHVLDLIKTINSPSKIVCGLSMGGAIVQNLLINESKYFNLAILINTGARLKVSQKIINIIQTNYNNYLKLIIKLGILEKKENTKIIDKIIKSSKKNPKTVLFDYKICNNFDNMKDVKSILIPTLIITAAKDLLTPTKYGQYLANQINRSFHINIKETGHMSPVEKPQKTNKIIKKFIILNTNK